jgi:hypothetical protein
MRIVNLQLEFQAIKQIQADGGQVLFDIIKELEIREVRNCFPYFFLNFNETELIQYLSPVG